MPPKRTSTSETPAITLDAIRQLINDGISSALKTQAVTMASASKPFYFNVKKMEDEFYNLVVKGNDLKTYIRRFQELAVLCPNMVPNAEKLMEVFISGLPRSIEGNVTASKPQTLEEAINIAQRLMDQIIKRDSVQETNNHKRRFEDRRNTNNNNYPNEHNNNNHSNNHNHNNYQDNRNNNNHNNDYHQQQHKRQEAFKTYAATNGYTGNLPLCKRCRLHHTGPCSVKCQVCNKIGHQTKYCKNKRPTTRNDLQTVSVICNACGKKEHYANQRSKANNSRNNFSRIFKINESPSSENYIIKLQSLSFCYFIIESYYEILSIRYQLFRVSICKVYP
ncbi:hypothetical protein Tco_1570446 [Tanacetum coccineum]